MKMPSHETQPIPKLSETENQLFWFNFCFITNLILNILLGWMWWLAKVHIENNKRNSKIKLSLTR